jgi:hypothetical protein
MPNDTTQPCAPGARCNRWRTCPTCGAIRQAKHAHAAEQISPYLAYPTYYVLVPDESTPDGIAYSRRWFSENAHPITGLWTVEAGSSATGLHLNVISDYHELPQTFAGRWWHQKINGDTRRVAAYISKPSGAPPRTLGIKRTSGTFGTITAHLIAGRHTAPIPAAIAIQQAIAPHFTPQPAPPVETDHDRARRWLAVIYSRYPNLARHAQQMATRKRNDSHEPLDNLKWLR